MERLKTNNNTTSVSFKKLTEDLNFSENLDAIEYERVFVNCQRWLTKFWSKVKATHKLRFLLLFHKCYIMHICFVSCVVFLFWATGVELKLAWFSKASSFFHFLSRFLPCSTVYRNFRSITRTVDYPHGRLPAPADYCIRRKKKSTDYPHRWITRTLLFNFFGGENVTLRRYISVFQAF